MDVRIASANEYPVCDAWLEHRGTLPLHRSAWLTALAQAYGVPTMMVVARSADGGICGVLSLYRIRSAHGGRWYSLRDGCVATGRAVAAALVAAAVHEARDAGVMTMLVGGDMMQCALPYSTIAKQTMQLTVPQGADAAWESLRKKTRNMVRKSERAGVRIEAGQAHLRACYAAYAARMLHKRIPMHRYVFFEALTAAFGSSADILVARRGTEVLGGMVLLTSPRVAAYPFQAVHPGMESFAPTALLTWEAMRRCAVRGIPLLDMGESAIGSSTQRAKAFFGGMPTTVWYAGVNDAIGKPKLTMAFAMRAASMGMRYAPYRIGQRCGIWLKQRGRLV